LDDGSRPSSLDALVLGFLSLMLVPEVPAAWLRESLRTKAPRLARYVERLREECFGGVVQLDDAFSGAAAAAPTTKGILPWQTPERVSVAKIGNTLLNTLADATPILKEFRMNSRLQQSAKSRDEASSDYDRSEAKAISEYAIAQRRDLYISIASAVAGVAAMAGYLFYNGVIGIATEDDEEEEEYGGSSAQDILGIPIF
jgi:sorting and assembly machinery component 37